MNALRFLILAGCLIFGLAHAQTVSVVNGAISFQGDTVHLELSGYQNWQYDIKKTEDAGKPAIEMIIPPLNEASIKSISDFKSEYVTSVSVDRKGPDGKHRLKFILSGNEIDAFDYLTDQPSRLIVDFYVNPAASAVKAPIKKETKPAVKVSKLPKVNDKNRTPANDLIQVGENGPLLAENNLVKAGVFDGGDPEYSRFSIKDYEINEDAIIKASENYYIPFPMQVTPIALWEKLKHSPTIYEIIPKDSDENKQARLLLTLFYKKRFAVFLKTQKWFKEKYPKSEYHEVLDFVMADVHLELWKQSKNLNAYESAIIKYKEAIKKFPLSPLAERTSLRLGFLSLERGDLLGSIRLFNEHLQNKEIATRNEVSKDLARLGMVQALTRLSRWDDAITELNNLERMTKNPDLKAEAAFRKGDVYANAKKYPEAIAAYQLALKTYPQVQNMYPNAFYNQAESLFLTKKYKESSDVFLDFIRRFPTETHSAFAMTRLGELLSIMGADQAKVVGAYLETYFRFGDSPKAVIARLHLLGKRMKGMKDKEVRNAIEEVMKIVASSELPNIEQFSTVTVADGFSDRQEYQKSIDLLSKYYKENPNSVNVPLITNRIISNINNKIRSEVIDGDFISALKTHSQYSDDWLKTSKRLDTKYNVGRAYEMAGVPSEAGRYYQDVLNRLYAILGTPEYNEVNVIEKLPSLDELNLRRAVVHHAENKLNKSYDDLKNIKSPETMPEPAQIERVTLAADLLEKRGDTDSAIRYLGELLKEWKGQPELVAAPYLRLSEIQLKQNKIDEALVSLEKVETLQNDSGKVPALVHAKALEQIGNLYAKKGNPVEASKAYQELLNKYEDSRPLSSIRYKLGEIYFAKGDIQKANEVWRDFKGEKSEFWKNLAQEQLKDSEWKDDYRKYIKRIPAMSENEQSQ